MCVAVEEKWNARRVRRGNVKQAERQAEALQRELRREIESVIVIPKHGKDRGTESTDCLERRGVAKVAEVPNFICRLKGWMGGLRQFSVRIGDHSDVHGSGLTIERIADEGKMCI